MLNSSYWGQSMNLVVSENVVLAIQVIHSNLHRNINCDPNFWLAYARGMACPSLVHHWTNTLRYLCPPNPLACAKACYAML